MKRAKFKSAGDLRAPARFALGDPPKGAHEQLTREGFKHNASHHPDYATSKHHYVHPDGREALVTERHDLAAGTSKHSIQYSRRTKAPHGKFSDTQPPRGTPEHGVHHATLAHRDAAKHLEHALESHREAAYHLERGNHKEAKEAWAKAKEHLTAAKYSHGELGRHHEMFKAIEDGLAEMSVKFEYKYDPSKESEDPTAHGRLLKEGYKYIGNDGRHHLYEHTSTLRKRKVKMYHGPARHSSLSTADGQQGASFDAWDDARKRPNGVNKDHHEKLIKHGYAVHHNDGRGTVTYKHEYYGKNLATHKDGKTSFTYGGRRTSPHGGHAALGDKDVKRATIPEGVKQEHHQHLIDRGFQYGGSRGSSMSHDDTVHDYHHPGSRTQVHYSEKGGVHVSSMHFEKKHSNLKKVLDKHGGGRFMSLDEAITVALGGRLETDGLEPMRSGRLKTSSDLKVE